MRKADEAEAAARALAKEEAEKAAKKASKKGGGKAKKPPKGAAAAAPPPTPPEDEDAAEPPSVLEVYEAVKREVEWHRAFRKEEAARQWAEERLVPRDPTGEAVLQEVGRECTVGAACAYFGLAWRPLTMEFGWCFRESGGLESRLREVARFHVRRRERWIRDTFGTYPSVRKNQINGNHAPKDGRQKTAEGPGFCNDRCGARHWIPFLEICGLPLTKHGSASVAVKCDEKQ